MKPVQCARCGKRFGDANAVQQHARDAHGSMAASGIAREDDEPSMADLMVDAELRRAMGEPVEDWLADMLP